MDVMVTVVGMEGGNGNGETGLWLVAEISVVDSCSDGNGRMERAY